jgi:hypothetical protein
MIEEALMNVQQQIVRTIDLERALSKLSPQQRTAIVLHYEGLTYEHVGNRLGIGKWKVKKLVYEGLCAIRELWGVRLPGPSVDHDGCWPVLMRSLWRHAKGSHLTAGELQSLFGCDLADLTGVAVEPANQRISD